MDMILQLGFIPNWVKSELAPAQMFMYLGVVFDQVEGSVHPTDAHILFHDISSMYLVRASRISGSTEHVIQMIQETTPVGFVPSLGWSQLGHSSVPGLLVQSRSI